MEAEYERSFSDPAKAVDFALWLKFKYRMDKREFIIQEEAPDSYRVVPSDGMQKSKILIPENYSDMDYKEIETIHKDLTPLNHWQELGEIISNGHDELLRFILFYQVPLEKWVRYELASRGYDNQYHWLGVEKSKEV